MKRKGSCHCQKVVWEFEVEDPIKGDYEIMHLDGLNHPLFALDRVIIPFYLAFYISLIFPTHRESLVISRI